MKVGRNKVAVRLLKSNADGKTYIVKNLKTGKPFFVPNEKAFVDFQSEAERQKAMNNIAEEDGTSNASNTPNVPNDTNASNISNVSNDTNESKTSKVPNIANLSKKSKVPNESKVSKTSKIPKRPQIMGHSKCAFVKALGQNGYKYYEAKKVLDALGISMPDASVKIQIYFGKNEKTWAKFGNPAELTESQKSEIENILR